MSPPAQLGGRRTYRDGRTVSHSTTLPSLTSTPCRRSVCPSTLLTTLTQRQSLDLGSRRAIARWLLGSVRVRRGLYLHGRGLRPLRSIAHRLVDRERERLVANGVPEWEGDAGFLYDLRRRLMSKGEVSEIQTSHYDRTLEHLSELVGTPATIVDYGCGPGFLTAAIASRFPSAHVVGADMRHETLALNRTLMPTIEWVHLDHFDMRNYDKPATVVLDGVANYLTAEQLHAILSSAAGIVFYYAAAAHSDEPASAATPFLAELESAGFSTVVERHERAVGGRAVRRDE